MCSDAHSITLITQEIANVIVKPIRLGKTISLLAACDIPLELEFRFEYGCKKDTQDDKESWMGIQDTNGLEQYERIVNSVQYQPLQHLANIHVYTTI